MSLNKYTMKTAVEWLEDTLYPYLNKEDKEYTDVLFNKAKEMEKDQIMGAYQADVPMCSDGDAEEYYNTIFNS